VVGRFISLGLLAVTAWLLHATAVAALPSDPTQPFIEVELEPETAYVQSMVHYRVRLYRNSHLQRGYFLDRQIPDMVTELSGDTPPRYVTRDGREYELLERHYLLFPQRSGNITLPAAVFSSRDLFVQGPVVTLSVKPRSDSGSGAWLPAMELQLQQELDLPEDSINSGMQLQRNIRIRAKGLTGAQLPTIVTPQLEGMEIQVLGSEVEQQIIDGVMTGQRHVRQLLIPKRGGEFTLPEIKIRWWNSISNSQQTTVLPATTLAVMDIPMPQVQPSTLQSQPGAEQREETGDKSKTIPKYSTNLLLLALLLSLIVYGLLIWHYRIFPRLQRQLHISASIQRFKTACQSNNPAVATHALLEWGELVMGEAVPVSVLGLRKLLTETDALDALRELDRAIYTSPNPVWSGKSACETVLPLLKQQSKRRSHTVAGALPALYGQG